MMGCGLTGKLEGGSVWTKSQGTGEATGAGRLHEWEMAHNGQPYTKKMETTCCAGRVYKDA